MQKHLALGWSTFSPREFVMLMVPYTKNYILCICTKNSYTLISSFVQDALLIISLIGCGQEKKLLGDGYIRPHDSSILLHALPCPATINFLSIFYSKCSLSISSNLIFISYSINRILNRFTNDLEDISRIFFLWGLFC